SPAKFAFLMVSDWLTAFADAANLAAPVTAPDWRCNDVTGKSKTPAVRRRFVNELATSVTLSLLPVLLDTRGTQTCKTMPVDRILPGQEFLDRQRVAAARFLK